MRRSVACGRTLSRKATQALFDRQAGSRPLPFREGDEGGLLPFTELGVQLRGAIPLGYGDGTRAEYSLYVTNGPRFASDVRGAFFETNNTDQNRPKGYGARLGFELLPYDAGL